MNKNLDQTNDHGWVTKLKSSLRKSSETLTDSLSGLLHKPKLDQQTLDALEESLIVADLGVSAAREITTKLTSSKFNQTIDEIHLRNLIADEIVNILEPVAIPLSVDNTISPQVILVCGVNGSGKTTTIGKLANNFSQNGNSILLAAGDTFRAAASDQLKIWGDRANCKVISSEKGSDPASLVFEAYKNAQEKKYDILLIDTAGRLQNKSDLMEELQKIIRVSQKIDARAPHDCLLVLDATVGQNAHSQVKVFSEMINISGLILTKLDGSAKGGVLISLAQEHKIPIHAIGVGEQLEDLRPFKPRDFANSLLGL